MFFVYGTVFLVGILVGYLLAPIIGEPCDGTMNIDPDADSDDKVVSFKLDPRGKKAIIRDSVRLKIVVVDKKKE